MNRRLAATDWIADRGAQWHAHLEGMEAMLEPINAPLLDALELDAPSRIAEIGCGGGGTTLELARRAPPGSVVHAFDISPKLVEVARARSRGDEVSISFEVADMATAAPERAYDRLVSRFGVMFFDEPERAFANLARWLAPGGRLAFAVWGPTADNTWVTTVRDAVARVVELPATDPDAPGPFRYADARGLLALLESAGFSDLAARPWRGRLPIGGALSPADAARFALSAFSSFNELLARAGDGALDEAQRSLTACFTQHREDGAVRLDAHVHLVTGRR